MNAVYIGIVGAWIFSDGLYSILLYTGTPAYHGPKQTWARDHSLRCVRMALGLFLVAVACWGA